MTLLPGTRLGPYEVLSPLGAGGMGEVYRSRDPRLGREVAVKVLPSAYSADPDRLSRFKQEARAASKLDHPNILVIHDIGLHENSPYVVSELLEGETLQKRLDSGPVPVRKAVEYALQIAQGLAAAHDKGIVHRDLKPANLFLTKDGRVKILDFGLAKLVQAEDGSTVTAAPAKTESGVVLGTVGYMSPEQVRGQSADHRSDIFSFGAVLYEMISGERPFRGASAADIMSAILKEDPRALATTDSGISPAFARMVRHCLEKDPAERFQSARDVAFDLQALSEIPGRGVAPLRLVQPWVWRAAGVAGVLLVIGALWLGRSARGPEPKAAASRAPAVSFLEQADVTSVAVLPFANMSEDASNEYFSDGVTEELLNTLARIPGLRVAGRTSSFSFKGKNEDLRVIGQRLNVGAILEGSVRKSGERVRITAQLVNAADGFHLWSETYDRTLDDIFAVQEDIARSVSRALQVTLLAGGELDSRVQGRNVEAYNTYLQGRYFHERLSQEGLEKAVDYYKRALALDPNYALAWSGLAHAYADQAGLGYVPYSRGFENAREAAERAVALDKGVSDAWSALGRINRLHDWDWKEADASFQRALAIAPGSVPVIAEAARLAQNLGRLEEAFVLASRAVQLDPLDVRSRYILGDIAWTAKHLNEAETALKKVIELDSDFPDAHFALGKVYLSQSRPEAALAEMQLESMPSYRRCGLAMAYHALGRLKEADATLAELREKDGDTAAFEIAEIYAYRSEADEAFEWLERSYEQRDTGIAWTKCSVLLRNLKDDPRYATFLKKIGLPV